MKIETNKIPPTGMTQEEAIDPLLLDLNTEVITFKEPVRVKADISRITNTVHAAVTLTTSADIVCSRCLRQAKIGVHKDITLDYIIDRQGQVIDINPDVRQELILDCPIKPLCRAGCKGVCSHCGKDLNEGPCECS